MISNISISNNSKDETDNVILSIKDTNQQYNLKNMLKIIN
jgi:hypothetical protein